MNCIPCLLLLTLLASSVSNGQDCTDAEILNCSRDYLQYKLSADGYDIPYKERCSIAAQVEQCLIPLREACSDDTMDIYDQERDGFRLMLLTICNMRLEAEVYINNTECFQTYLGEYMQCFQKFNNTKRRERDFAAYPCCRPLARMACNAKVYMKRCPDAASLLQSFAKYAKYQTFPICKKRNLFSYCASPSKLEELYASLQI